MFAKTEFLGVGRWFENGVRNLRIKSIQKVERLG